MTLDAYASLETFRAYIRQHEPEGSETDPDEALETLALEAGARAIDRACNRDFREAGDTATARVFTAYRRRRQGEVAAYVVDIDDTFDAVTVALDATGLGDYDTATTAFRLGPPNAAALGKPFGQIVFNRGVPVPLSDLGVEVTTKWGWTATPSTISLANCLQASRFLKRRDAPFGVAGSPDTGSELRLLAKLDPDVALMVGTLRRNWGAC